MSLTRLAWRSLRRAPAAGPCSRSSASPSASRCCSPALATNAAIDVVVDRTVSDLVGRADLRVARLRRDRPEPRDAGGDRRDAGRRRRRARHRAPDVSLRGRRRGRALPAAGDRRRHRPGARSRSSTTSSWSTGSASPAPTNRARSSRERLADRGRPLVGCRAHDPGRRAIGDLPGRGILAGDGPAVGTLGRTVVVPLGPPRPSSSQDAVTRVDSASARAPTRTPSRPRSRTACSSSRTCCRRRPTSPRRCARPRRTSRPRPR